MWSWCTITVSILAFYGVAISIALTRASARLRKLQPAAEWDRFR